MTEYWLQKKTIGGWSQVTWYVDEIQARENYKRCIGNGMSGYSWRLVEVKELEVSMLNDVVEVVQSSRLIDGDKLTIAGTRLDGEYVINSGWDQPVPFKEKSSGWGDVAQTGWNSTSDNPGSSGLSLDSPKHGLTGSVWLVHHGLKKKTRVKANDVERLMKEGYVRGSPKTKFER